MRSAIIGAVLILGLGAGTVAWKHQDRRAGNGAPVFQVTGTVLGPIEGQTMRVAHDEIVGLMPAMTMPFTLAEGEPKSLRPGDRVRFALRLGPKGTTAERVVVTGRAALPAPPAGAPDAVPRLKRGDALPAIALVDERGTAITAADFEGQLTVVTFIFTRCPVPEFCPRIASRFKELQTALAGDRSLPQNTRLLSITIDPRFDTPAVLDTYARSIGADYGRWRFATGDPDEVLRVARLFSVYMEQNGALLDHTLATAVIGPDGRLVEIWRGNGWKTSEVTGALANAGLAVTP